MRTDFEFGALNCGLWIRFWASQAAIAMPVDYDAKNLVTYRVRRNATTDSRAFVAALEAFSSERHPVRRSSIHVNQVCPLVSTLNLTYCRSENSQLLMTAAQHI